MPGTVVSAASTEFMVRGKLTVSPTKRGGLGNGSIRYFSVHPAVAIITDGGVTTLQGRRHGYSRHPKQSDETYRLTGTLTNDTWKWEWVQVLKGKLSGT